MKTKKEAKIKKRAPFQRRNRLGLTHPPINVNTREHLHLTWNDLKKEDLKLTNKILKLAEKYGYRKMKPLMPKEDIEAINNIFETYKPNNVLEWGCGGSTVFFSKFDFIKSWTSIEHVPQWAEAVRVEASPKVKVIVEPLNTEYVTLPSTLSKKFDLIIVDGRRRVDCLKVAATLIKEGCPVILHDSSRIRYQEGLKAFKTVKVLTPGKAEERNVDYHKQPDGFYYHEGVTMAMIY